MTLEGGRFSSKPLSQHCTSGSVSLPCADMRDGGIRVASSFSPRRCLPSIQTQPVRVISDADAGNRSVWLTVDRVESIWHLAQRVSEAHGCIAGVLLRHVSMVSNGSATRNRQQRLDNKGSTIKVCSSEKQKRERYLGGRQALVETAVTALHFGWCLPPLRGHERFAYTLSQYRSPLDAVCRPLV